MTTAKRDVAYVAVGAGQSLQQNQGTAALRGREQQRRHMCRMCGIFNVVNEREREERTEQQTNERPATTPTAHTEQGEDAEQQSSKRSLRQSILVRSLLRERISCLMTNYELTMNSVGTMFRTQPRTSAAQPERSECLK